MQRLLGSGGGGAWVLDSAAFVAAAGALPAARLRAGLENCLLECTNTRLPRLHELPPAAATGKVNAGAAALVQLAGGGPAAAQLPALFPPSAGLLPLGALVAGAVLPPSAARGLLSPPAVQLFVAHSGAGAGRRSAAEHFDMGSVPSLYERGRAHTRAAARRGGTLYTLLTGAPVWQRFELGPAAGGSSGGGSGAGASTAAEGAPGKAAGGKQPRQKRKQPAAAAAADAAAGGMPPQAAAGGRRALGPCTLLRSACSCSHPDLGALWCSHRCDAVGGLLADPALHVLDCDALEALLAPLSPRQLAQLLLTGEG